MKFNDMRKRKTILKIRLICLANGLTSWKKMNFLPKKKNEFYNGRETST